MSSTSAYALQLVVEESPFTADARPVRQDLLAGHLEAASYGGMVGFGETFLPAFALAAGVGEVAAGLVTAVPMLAGGLMQLVSPTGIRALGSNRKWVVSCAAVQGLSFLPLVLFALRGEVSTVAMFLIVSLYWAAGLATGPAWNTWMGTIVPRLIRARYFACRTRLSQAVVLTGFLAGGGALHWASQHGEALTIFAALFAAAGLFRLASATCMSCQSEPVSGRTSGKPFSIATIGRQFREGRGGPLLMYLVVVQGAVQFSGPYFTPFMFQKLHLSYVQYALLIAVSYLARIVSLPLWGHLAHRVGANRLLWLGGIGIVPISAMWLASKDFFWLMFIQLVGGAAWAAYELAFQLLFFESIPKDERTGVLTLYNLVNTAAWVSGSLLGGLVLQALGAGHAAYLTLFGLSTVGRAFALLLLPRVAAKSTETATVTVRTLRPVHTAGAIDAPILSTVAADSLAKKHEEEQHVVVEPTAIPQHAA
jgi:hypothetical protein